MGTAILQPLKFVCSLQRRLKMSNRMLQTSISKSAGKQLLFITLNSSLVVAFRLLMISLSAISSKLQRFLCLLRRFLFLRRRLIGLCRFCRLCSLRSEGLGFWFGNRGLFGDPCLLTVIVICYFLFVCVMDSRPCAY